MLSRICLGSKFKVIQYVTKFDSMWDTGNCDVVNVDITLPPPPPMVDFLKFLTDVVSYNNITLIFD